MYDNYTWADIAREESSDPVDEDEARAAIEAEALEILEALRQEDIDDGIIWEDDR